MNTWTNVSGNLDYFTIILLIATIVLCLNVLYLFNSKLKGRIFINAISMLMICILSVGGIYSIGFYEKEKDLYENTYQDSHKSTQEWSDNRITSIKKGTQMVKDLTGGKYATYQGSSGANEFIVKSKDELYRVGYNNDYSIDYIHHTCKNQNSTHSKTSKCLMTL